MPAVQDALHTAITHAIIQAGEEAEPNGAGHGGGACSAAAALIKGLEEKGRAVGGTGRPSPLHTHLGRADVGHVASGDLEIKD